MDLRKMFSAFLVLALLIVGTPISGWAAEGDSNFTNVVASGDVTVGDDLTVTDDVTTQSMTVRTGSSPVLADGLFITTGISNQYTRIHPQYMQMYVRQASLRGASGGLKAGTVMAIGNANNSSDCGLAGGGSTFVVCVTDGSAWRVL